MTTQKLKDHIPEFSNVDDTVEIDTKVTFSKEIVPKYVKSQTKSADYTMTAADSGIVTYIDTDAKTITLPATVVGMVFTFVNSGDDGDVKLTISPNSSDKIQGAGISAADNKDLVNTKSTAKKGDKVTLIGDGADGWFVSEMSGTWVRET